MRSINYLFVCKSYNPARSSRINVGIARLCAARANSDNCCVPASSINISSGTKSEFLRGLLRKFSCHVVTFNYARKMVGIYFEHAAELTAPAVSV